MDSKIRVLHGKIQRQEISVEQAALEFERLRAQALQEPAPRRIEAPPANAELSAAAVYTMVSVPWMMTKPS